MNAYSEDLRRKVVEALARGTNKSHAARLFGVRLSFVKRYAKMVSEGRTLAPKKHLASAHLASARSSGWQRCCCPPRLLRRLSLLRLGSRNMLSPISCSTPSTVLARSGH